MAISYPNKANTRRRQALTYPPREITLGMTPETVIALEELMREMDAPVDEVLTQAFGLLLMAVEGQKHGQSLCLVDEDSNIVTEIVNFGIESERQTDPWIKGQGR